MDQLGRIERKLDIIAEQLSELRVRIGRIEVRQDERLSALSARLDRLDEHIETELERADERIGQVAELVAAHNDRLVGLENQLGRQRWIARLLWAALGATPGGAWLARHLFKSWEG